MSVPSMNQDGIHNQTVDSLEQNAFTGFTGGPIRTRVSTEIEYASSQRNVTSSPSSSRFLKPSSPRRLVAVRFFLDRPGFGLHNSAMRLWFDPPEICKPSALKNFLKAQNILLPELIVEVYLDKFQSFMLLEACDAAAIEWDFEDTTLADPGIMAIRLTDVGYASRLDQGLSKSAAPTATPTMAPLPQHANTTPVGLFAFSLMVGLETTDVLGKLNSNFVSTQYVLAQGPYMFFAGGMLMVITGTLQVFRNNIYGAVAFLCFGSFWFANGTRSILMVHFSPEGSIADQVIEDPDPWGLFIRSFFILAFSMALLKQTLIMSKLSTILIGLLCAKILFQSVSLWSKAMQWCQVVFGYMTSIFAFYVFLVEFTNQVYHREVFPTLKWSAQDSPEEIFGAAGKPQTLYSKAAHLRQAAYPNVSGVRSALAGHRTTTVPEESVTK